MRTSIPLAALLAFGLAACTTTGDGRGGTEVTRYHLGQPIAQGAITVEPASARPVSPEYEVYAGAVAGELTRLGFTPGAGTTSQYVATVGFERSLRGQVRTPPKFSIGLGGGSFGRGGGVGGGLSTGFGSKTRDVIGSDLFVQLRRRSDGTVVWEGRAQRTGLSGRGEQPVLTAQRLAAALFKGFPGESGITITVP